MTRPRGISWAAAAALALLSASAVASTTVASPVPYGWISADSGGFANAGSCQPNLPNTNYCLYFSAQSACAAQGCSSLIGNFCAVRGGDVPGDFSGPPASYTCVGTISTGYAYEYYTCPAPLGPGGVGRQTACSCPPGEVVGSDGASCVTPPAPDPKNLGDPPCTCPTCNCIKNPINAGVANKYQTETDYIGSGSFPLTFRRTYNSLPVNGANMGAHWRAGSDRRIGRVIGSGVNAAVVYRDDGKIYSFSLANGVFTGPADIADRLSFITDSTGAVTGFKYVTSPGDETEIYKPTGELLSISARNGLTQTFGYDSQGRLSSITDPFGRTLSLTYDTNNRIATMTDPAGGVYQYAYDAAGNLVSVTYPGGAVRTYVYNESANTSGANLPNALTGIVDENLGRFATYKYDTSGRAISTEHAGGAERATITYGTNSAVVTDALGTQRTYGFQTVLDVVRNNAQTQPAASGSGSATQSSVYDANGNVTSYTDYNGNVTHHTYDLTRNLETSRIEAFGTAQARTISTQWHPTFRLPAQVAEPLRITTYVYNGDGGASCGLEVDGVTLVPGVLCSKTIQPTSDATGAQGFGAVAAGTPRTWSYTYNANGSVLTMDGPRTDVADVTTYTYYANDDPDPGKRGNVATITNALGQTTSITAYNAYGQPLTIVDPNGLTTNLAYDSRMRLTSRNVGGETTSYGYDAVGQLTQVTLPDSSSLTYTYDAAHRLIGIADNLGDRIAYTLDGMGNRTQEQVFDPSNSLAQTRSRIYDALNRLHQDIGAQNQTTQYAYDNQGNVTSVTDPLSHATGNQYDALNRLVQVTDPNLGQTRYAYNGIDQLTSVTDPRTLTTSYNYDGLSNLNSQLSPDTGTTANTFDAAGNLLTQTDAKGQTTTYVYDALNRVASITFQDGSKQVYTYDQGTNAIGRLASIGEFDPSQNQTSLLTYSYDQHGRVVTDTRTVAGVAYLTSYQYDSAGRLSGMTYPSGRTVAYTFDPLGRINQVSTTSPVAGGQTQVLASNIGYQPFGGVNGYLLGNGQTYTRGFDQDGRIASYNLGATIYALGYDAASRIVFINDTGNPQNSNTYGYDNLDRLTNAVLPNLPYAYSYDAVGNRTTKTVGAASDSYSYSSTSNQLTGITGSTNRSFTFDANGSTTNDGNNQYVYDTRGRMVQSMGALGSTAYQVNALGQRIRKTNSSDDRVFVYDTRGRLITEATAAGAVTREYVYLNDIPLAVIQ